VTLYILIILSWLILGILANRLAYKIATRGDILTLRGYLGIILIAPISFPVLLVCVINNKLISMRMWIKK
jgi:hypothetical protein